MRTQPGPSTAIWKVSPLPRPMKDQHIHDMLNDGRLKGIRTRVGWVIHPACVERVAREGIGHGKKRSSSPTPVGLVFANGVELS